jgi:osmotically-inducible protein OsmY
LRTDPTLSAVVPQVRITIEDGKATIKGAVKSEDQKQQIEKALQQVDGVNSVDDQLKVSATQNDSTNP